MFYQPLGFSLNRKLLVLERSPRFLSLLQLFLDEGLLCCSLIQFLLMLLHLVTLDTSLDGLALLRLARVA